MLLSQSKTGNVHSVPESGHFYIQNYAPEDYSAHHQNWFITQDKNGFIYAGNGEGVLEYDGAAWRLISSPGLESVRTVVVDENNVKWVGADRELGYLAPDSVGFLQFKSLKDKIPPSDPLTANIWQIFPDNGRVLFVTDNKIYSWQDDKFHVIPYPGDAIYREYQVNGTVYFNIPGPGKGMFQLVDDSLQLIPGGELLENVRGVVALPYKKKSVLFATRKAGFLIYNGSSVTRLKSDVFDYLKEHSVYAGRRLPDSTYAFATLRKGVIIMDKNGRRVKEITAADGILNNEVHGLTVDNRNGLWLALQTGISRVESQMPYTFFDKRSGLNGTVSAIARHKGRLYVGTFNGLYALEPRSGIHSAKFYRIEEIESGCFALLSLGEDLLAATANGIFQVSEDNVNQINNITGTRALYQSKQDTNRVYVGHMHGLSTIYFNNGQWRPEKDLDQIKEDIFSITANEKGALWLGTSLHKVINVRFPQLQDPKQGLDLESIEVKRFGEGLPEGSINVWLIDGDLLVTSNGEGGPLFKLDPGSGTFFSDTEFGKKFGLDSLQVYPRAYQDDGQYILLESTPIQGKRYRFSAYKDDTGHYSVQRLYDERFRGITETHLFWDNKNVVWSGGETITRVDLGTNFNFKAPFNTYVRKVIAGQDSAIFGGDQSNVIKPVLDYSNSSLRFDFAAPYFAGSNATTYQYRLEGLDDTWSEWTKETRKDYTNLPEGYYKFRARAQNMYGELSATGTFDFEILPPWYRTWWAYVFYMLMGTGFLLLVVKWRSRHLIKEKEALEKVVEERTSEVSRQARQLEKQAHELKELDRAKSQFFANISHEFRTPLTLILGQVKRLESGYSADNPQPLYRMIKRNGQRVLGLVNQLLDLSTLESGKMKLQAQKTDLGLFLKPIVAAYDSLAEDKGIKFNFDFPEDDIFVYLDTDKMEKVLHNVISNAFKFSEEDSEIAITVAKSEIGGKSYARIKVQDSGRGIASDQLDKIFDRFYQGDDSNTKRAEVSGIELALAKELVTLHQGTITVKSVVGKGSCFTISLPLGKEHLTNDQIVDNMPSIVPDNDKAALPAENITRQPEPILATNEGMSKEAADLKNTARVLVVEDNTDMRQYIHQILCAHYQVAEALDGKGGFEKAAATIPDLVISDVMMPEMDGFELCRRLKSDERTSHIPVILLTAKAGKASKLEGLEIRADDYLTKPFDADELLILLRNRIEQRKKLRERFSKEVTLQPKDIAITSADERFLQKAMDIIEENMDDFDFNVEAFVDQMYLGHTQVNRKLKALTDFTPVQFIRFLRLKRAAQKIARQEDTISQIAYSVGFNNLSYFAKCFKEQFGQSPPEYSGK